MRRLTPSGSRPTSTPPTVRRAARRLQQPAQHADRRRLAGAVAAEEAEDLALRDVERQPIDGDERRRSAASGRDGDRVDRRSSSQRALPAAPRPAATLASACVRSSSACSSATCASSTSVLVATPAAKRSPTTRRASVGAAHAVVGRARSPRGSTSSSSSRCRTSSADRRVELGEPRLGARVAMRGGLGDFGCARGRRRTAASSTLTPTSHDGCHASCARKDARVRVGVVDAAADRDRRLARPACAAAVRSPAALDATRQRLRARAGCCAPRRPARRPSRRRRRRRVERDRRARCGVPAAAPIRRAELGLGDVARRSAPRSAASAGATAAPRRDSTSFGGTRPASSWLRTSRRCASTRVERLARRRARASRAVTSAQ